MNRSKDMANKKRALISVTDKSGITELAQELVTLGFEILSTGGTAKALAISRYPCDRSFSLHGLSGNIGRPG